MNILVLGFASIARRRAIPALLGIAEVENIDIASHSPNSRKELPQAWSGRIFGDYGEALAESDAALVYIPLVNALHEEWVETSLESGRHIVVEKPACLSHEATVKLVDKAAKAGLCIAEATVFADHPQFAEVTKLIGENGGATRVSACFSFPPMATENFRNKPSMGGGSLNDIGPYAAAVSRVIFGDEPDELFCRILTRHQDTAVDTAFSLLAVYSGGRSMVGNFGFDTEYQNWLTVTGPGCSLAINRAFSTPPDLENAITVNRKNDVSVFTVPPGDAFANFFKRVLDGIAAGDWRGFTDAMTADSRFLGRLRASSESR